MAIRGAAVVFSALAFATACTAVLGVEDVPKAPAGDGGSSGSTSNEGGVTNEAGPVGGDVKAAITAYTTAYCAKYRECFRAAFDLSYKDPDECASMLGQIASKSAGLPGATASATDFQGCAARVSALTCDAFNSSDSALTCTLKGARKDGEKCLSGYQCQSGVCATSINTCRTCIAAREKGADCSEDGTCGPGLKCNGYTCVAESTLGQSCSELQPCTGSLKCAGGVCVRQPDTAGTTCTTEVGCALDRGLVCLNGKCISIIINGPGGQCDYGPPAGEQPKFCRRFAGCNAGKCNAPPGEGDPCGDAASGLGFCPDSLVCLNGTCTRTPESSFCE